LRAWAFKTLRILARFCPYLGFAKNIPIFAERADKQHLSTIMKASTTKYIGSSFVATQAMAVRGMLKQTYIEFMFPESLSQLLLP